jgi:hypothetical protein
MSTAPPSPDGRFISGSGEFGQEFSVTAANDRAVAGLLDGGK